MSAPVEHHQAVKPTRVEVEGLTIDSAHSMDLDDAFWVTPDADGYLVDVSIADAAAVVKVDTAMDAIARQKMETLYRAGYNKPMLPRDVSEGRASLLPGKQRKVLTVRLRLDAAMDVVGIDMLRGKLRSAAKLSHDQVDLALLNPAHPLHEQLALCQLVATAFYERRRAAGACAIYDVRSRLYADEDGVIRKYDGAPSFHAQTSIWPPGPPVPACRSSTATTRRRRPRPAATRC